MASNRKREDPPSDTAALYDQAARVLHSEHPLHDILCRDELRDSVTRFITQHLDNRTSGSLYISGRPGTGKTLTCRRILEQIEIQLRAKTAYINCKLVSNIYVTLYNLLCPDNDTPKEAVKSQLEKYLACSKLSIVVLLDEMDSLVSEDSAELYHVFELTSESKSKLIVIGIANVLDLTVRFLPRLRNMNIVPVEISVPTYTSKDLETMITQRLADAVQLFDKDVLRIIANRVANQSGDARRMLDVCSIIVRHARDKNLAIITPMEAVNVLKTLDRSDNTIISQLSPTQSVVLCIVGYACSKSKAKDQSFPVSSLYKIYTECCRRVPALTTTPMAAINDAVLCLEGHGLVSIEGSKKSHELSAKKLRLEISKNELQMYMKNASQTCQDILTLI